MTADLGNLWYLYLLYELVYHKPFSRHGIIMSKEFGVGERGWLQITFCSNSYPFRHESRLAFFAYYNILIWIMTSQTFLVSVGRVTKHELN